MRHDTLLKEWQSNHPDVVFGTSTIVTSTVDTDASSTDPRLQAEADVTALLAQELNPAQTFYRQGKPDKKTNTPGPFYTLHLVTADTVEYHQAAELISGFWQEVGVQTTVEYVAPKDMSREVLKDRSYDVLLYGAIVGSDPDQYPFWHSSQVDFPGLNLSRYMSRAADKLLEQARTTTNDADQVTAYKKFQDILLSDRPAIFLYSPSYRYATSDRVQGIVVDRIFQPADRFANVTQWYVKTTGRWQF
jgi:ABC-type transport system substrate-binding protein